MKREGVIDIRDYSEVYSTWGEALVSERLTIRGHEIDVSICPIKLRPTIMSMDGSQDPNGSRTLFGAIVRDGTNWRRMATLPQPAQYSAGHYPWEARHERASLAVLSRYADDGSVTMPLPDALQTDEAMYETAAPGYSIDDTVRALATSYTVGRITAQELIVVLLAVRSSAHGSLVSLHAKGLKHNHPHTGNFNVDSRTARARVFDYTCATSASSPIISTIRTDTMLLTPDYPEDDFAVFEKSWRELLDRYNLSDAQHPEGCSADQSRMAVGKLEGMLAWFVLQDIGIDNLTDHDIQRFVNVQQRLADSLPQIRYPLDTSSERFRLRAARAAANIRRLLQDVF